MKPIYTRRAFWLIGMAPALAVTLLGSLMMSSHPFPINPIRDLATLLTPQFTVTSVEFLGIKLENIPSAIIIFVLLLLIIASILVLLQDLTLRTLAGSTFANTLLGRWMQRRHVKIRHQLQAKLDELERGYQTHDNEHIYLLGGPVSLEIRRRALNLSEYPLSDEEVAPTKFGNIIAALSSRLTVRYGIDLSTIWGHLLYLVPQEYRNSVEEAQSTMQAYIGATFAFLGLGTYMLVLALLTKTLSLSAIAWLLVYIILSFISYQAVIGSASQYSSTVREGIDLYRLEVAKRLGLRRPANLGEEQLLWRQVGIFLIRDDPEIAFHILDYSSASEDAGTLSKTDVPLQSSNKRRGAPKHRRHSS